MAIDIATMTRAAARRLLCELLLIGVLGGVGATFPRGVNSSEAWSFVGEHLSYLAHVLVGLLVLVEGGVAIRRFRGRVNNGVVAALCAGFFCALTSVTAGVIYVADGQGDGSLATMTFAWLGAMATYAVVWRFAAREVKKVKLVGT